MWQKFADLILGHKFGSTKLEMISQIVTSVQLATGKTILDVSKIPVRYENNETFDEHQLKKQLQQMLKDP